MNPTSDCKLNEVEQADFTNQHPGVGIKQQTKDSTLLKDIALDWEEEDSHDSKMNASRQSEEDNVSTTNFSTLSDVNQMGGHDESAAMSDAADSEMSDDGLDGGFKGQLTFTQEETAEPKKQRDDSPKINVGSSNAPSHQAPLKSGFTPIPKPSATKSSPPQAIAAAAAKSQATKDDGPTSGTDAAALRSENNDMESSIPKQQKSEVTQSLAKPAPTNAKAYKVSVRAVPRLPPKAYNPDPRPLQSYAPPSPKSSDNNNLHDVGNVDEKAELEKDEKKAAASSSLSSADESSDSSTVSLSKRPSNSSKINEVAVESEEEVEKEKKNVPSTPSRNTLGSAKECPISPVFKPTKGATQPRSSYTYVPNSDDKEKKPPQQVKFNVGGTIVQLPCGILLKYKESRLASMTRSAIRVGVPVPIPRQFDVFSHCIFYLVNGKVHLPTSINRMGFIKEMEYFGIPFDKVNISGGCAAPLPKKIIPTKQPRQTKKNKKKQITSTTTVSREHPVTAATPASSGQKANVVTDPKDTATGSTKPSSPSPLDLERNASSETMTRRSARRQGRELTPEMSPYTKMAKSRACGECESCLRDDCGECRECKDKKKFGGKNVLKLKCSKRRCDNMKKPLDDEEVKNVSKDVAMEPKVQPEVAAIEAKGQIKHSMATFNTGEPVSMSIVKKQRKPRSKSFDRVDKKGAAAAEKRWAENLMFLRPCIEEGGIINYAHIHDEDTRGRVKNYVKEQRRQFRRMENNELTSLTKERIKLLEEANFPKKHKQPSNKPVSHRRKPRTAVSAALAELGLKKKPKLSAAKPEASSLDLLCTVGSQTFSFEVDGGGSRPSTPTSMTSTRKYPHTKATKGSCMNCDACNRDDCGDCRACLDKLKNGGANTLRQKCYFRRCINIPDKHPPPLQYLVKTPGGGAIKPGTGGSSNIASQQSEDARMKAELARIQRELNSKAKGEVFGFKSSSTSKQQQVSNHSHGTRSNRRTFEQLSKKDVVDEGSEDEDSDEEGNTVLMDSDADSDADSDDEVIGDARFVSPVKQGPALPRGISLRPSGKYVSYAQLQSSSLYSQLCMPYLIIISFYISYLQQVQLRYAGAVRYIGLFDGRDESITAYNLAKECMLSFKSTNPTASEIKKNHDKMRKAAYAAAQYSSSDDDILFKPKASKAAKPVAIATSKVEGGKRGRGRPVGSKNVSKKVQQLKKSAVDKAVESGRMVSLAVAAASGCEKCIMELDDGIKTRHSHDDGCPRSRLPANAKHKTGPNESKTRGRNPPTTVNNYAKSFATKPRQPPSSRREVRKPPPPPAPPKSARLRDKVGPTKKPSVAPPIRKVPIDPSIYKKAKETAGSLPRGITERPSGKWQVQLYYLGKSRYIGVFDNRKDSAIGYELARAVMSSFKDKNPNPEQLKKNIMLMREAALSFKDAPLTPENSRKKQKTTRKVEAPLPPIQTTLQTQSAERSMRARKRHRDETNEASSGEEEEEEEEMPATKVAKTTSENDGALSTAEKCVGVVAYVLNSNKSLEELRNGGRDDIKDIVRPTLTFGNQFWKQIRLLLQKAIDAKEEGKTVDHASLLQMFYASNPETKPKTTASATTTTSSSAEGTTFTTGTAAAAYHLSCSVRGGVTEDLPEIGPGWLVNIIPRVGGERSDYYYFSPTGQRFRSMKQAKAYISESEGNIEFGSVGFSFKKMFTDKKGNDIGLYDGEVVDILSGNKVKCLYPADGYTEELSLSELKELVDIESKTLFDKLTRLESKTLNFGSVGHKFTKEFPSGKWFDGVVVKVLKNVGKCCACVCVQLC